MSDMTDVVEFSPDEERLQRQTDEGSQELRTSVRDVVVTGGQWPEG